MSEDLIKRSDAIGAITNHCENECYYRVDNWCPQCQREEFEEAIKVVPSAGRPQGEWICHEGGWKNFDYYPTKYECDQCHHYVDVASDKNFCPNCGSDMRKGADDE